MFDGFSLFDCVAWYVVFLFSTTAHEASHALAALRLGDDTAHRGGQVTLDPTPHIRREPFGMAVVPLLSYVLGGWMIGWASAPYDPDWARRYPKRAGLMAMAGPAANFALMLLAALLIRGGMVLGFFDLPHSVNFMHVAAPTREGLCYLAATLLSLLFSLNLLLFIFNLIPLPPLDGGSAPLLLLPDAAGLKYWEVMRSPGFSLFGMLIAWKLIGPVFSSLHLVAINLLYPGAHYM